MAKTLPKPITIVPTDNGYIVRVPGKTLVYATLEEVQDFQKEHFQPTKKE
jgi:hypothetical protein